MLDHQQIALQRKGAVGGQDHYPIGWRDDGLARRAGYVDADMKGARLALIDARRTEQAGNPDEARPDKTVGPDLLRRPEIELCGSLIHLGLANAEVGFGA